MEDKLYLIIGNNDVFIQKEIKKIVLEKQKNKEIEMIKYDLTETMIEDVIEDLDTYDMFLKQKIILGYHPPFLEEKLDDSFPLEKFLKYIKNPSDNILILIQDKINERLKLTNSIKEYFKVIKVKEISPLEFVLENSRGYTMENSVIRYFLNKVGSNFNTIYEELNKLKAYTFSTKIISKNDIDQITNTNIEASIFDLVEAILRKDKRKSYELYNHFINNGTEIFQVLVLLSNQIRLIYNVKVLSYLSDKEISQKLEVKEYPVKLARGKSYLYEKQELLNLLYEIGEMDEAIKSGKQLPSVSFLTFIMQM